MKSYTLKKQPEYKYITHLHQKNIIQRRRSRTIHTRMLNDIKYVQKWSAMQNAIHIKRTPSNHQTITKTIRPKSCNEELSWEKRSKKGRAWAPDKNIDHVIILLKGVRCTKEKKNSNVIDWKAMGNEHGAESNRQHWSNCF